MQLVVGGQSIQRRPVISLSKEAEDIMDHVVLACVILESALRVSDKSKQTRIASIGQYEASPGVVTKW